MEHTQGKAVGQVGFTAIVFDGEAIDQDHENISDNLGQALYVLDFNNFVNDFWINALYTR